MTTESSTQRTSQFLPQQKSRFVANISANLFSFALSILIGLWFTPYVIRHLGVAAYGLIPLAAQVISYLDLITVVLNGAVGRFLTIALERKDNEEANRIFNTALMGNVILVCLLFVPAVLASFHADAFFNVPAGFERPFAWLFFCIICSFFLSALNSSFSLASYCRNRFDLSNSVSIVSSLIRVGSIVALFTWFAPQVWHIGVAGLIALLFSMIGSVFIWRRLTPMLHIQPRSFEMRALRNLTGMGGWIVVNQLGTLLFLSIDLIVVNKLIGPEAGGRYGAIMQWSTMLRTLAGVIAGVFGPTIIMLYARHDIPGLVRYSQQAVKFLGLTIAFPIGIICGFSGSLLSVWLGPKFAPLAPLMSLMTIHLCVNLGVLPLFNVQVATKHVRLPGILTCVMGIMNLGLALLLAGPVGWGMYGVAAAGAIMLTAKNLVFTPWYAAHILGLRHDTFFRQTLPIISMTLVLTSLSWYVAHLFELHTWIGLIITGGVLALVYFLSVFALLLTRSERETASSMILPYLKRYW